MSTLDLPVDMLEVPANGVASARVKQLKIGSRELHFPPQQIVRERTGLGCRYRNRGQHYHAQNRGMQTGTNVPIVHDEGPPFFGQLGE
jgi:hypothetical protein